MSQNIFTGYSNGYRRGLSSLKSPWILPLDRSYTSKLEELSKKATSYQELACLSLYRPPQISLNFSGVKPLTSSPQSHLCFNYDFSPVGWYFLYGHSKSYRFTLMIFHINIDASLRNNCIYSIVGGYTKDDATWTPLPPSSGPGEYNCSGQNSAFTYSNDGISITFNTTETKMEGMIGYNNDKLTFSFDNLGYAYYNASNGGCDPCFGGLGSSYWSYTNIDATISVNTNGSEKGKGWFDHQIVSPGIPHGFLLQFLYGLSFSLKAPSPLKWLWLTIQLDDNDIQYMVSIKGLKQSQLPLKVNDKFKTLKAHKYSKGSAEYNIDANVVVLEVANVTFQNSLVTYPTKYQIELDGITVILQSFGTQDIVNMPSGGINWEGPGKVTDTNGNIIGKGFLEANNLNEDHLSRRNGMSGLDKIGQPKFSNRAVWLVFFWILWMVLFIISIIFMIKSRSN